MQCAHCHNDLEKTIGNCQFKHCGLENVWLQNWEMYVCAENHTFPYWPNLKKFIPYVAEQLIVSAHRLDKRALYFLRKSLHYSLDEMASSLCAAERQVIRWEGGNEDIPKEYDFRIRSLVMKKFFPPVKQLALRRALTEARENYCEQENKQPIYIRREDLMNVKNYEF